MALLAIVSANVGLASEFGSPNGYKFAYPKGWMILTGKGIADAKEEMPKEMIDWIARNKVDFKRIDVVLIRVGEGEFLENMNVVVNNQQIPVDEASKAKVGEEIKKLYNASGLHPEDFLVRMDKLRDRNVYVVDSKIRLPGIATPLRQRQYFIPGGGKTFIVTTSGTVESFPQYEQTFQDVLNSFQTPPPTRFGGFDFSKIVGLSLAGLVIGGIVGGVVALIRKLRGK